MSTWCSRPWVGMNVNYDGACTCCLQAIDGTTYAWFQEPWYHSGLPSIKALINAPQLVRSREMVAQHGLKFCRAENCDTPEPFPEPIGLGPIQASNLAMLREDWEAGRGELRGYPITWVIMVCNDCKMGCYMCPTVKRPTHISQEGADLFREVHPYLLEIVLTGGEPLRAADSVLDGFIPQEGKVASCIITSLVVPTSKVEKWANRVSLLQVSVHGPNQRILSKIQAAPNFDLLRRNLRLATSITGVEVITVIMRSNVEHLVEIVELLSVLGVRRWCPVPMRNFHGPDREDIFGVARSSETDALVAHWAPRAVERAHELGIVVSDHQLWPRMRRLGLWKS